MKYIKLFEEHKTKEDVTRAVNSLFPHWRININFVINDDLSVTTKRFYYSGEYSDRNKITKIPFKIKEISSDDPFEISYNNLTTLDGCPKKIKGSFWCDNNNLTTLKGGPEFVGKSMGCYNNNLKSLKYLPKSIGSTQGDRFDYGGNPCWNDENQLKYLPLNIMKNGKVHNIFMKNKGLNTSMLSSGWIFVMKKNVMDIYWEEKIKDEPELITDGIIIPYYDYTLDGTEYEGDSYTHKCNQISQELYDSFKYLFRAKNVFDFKN